MPDASAAREQIIASLRGSLPTDTMALWIEPSRAIAIEDQRLVLAFPPTISAWVQRRYATLLGNAARELGLDGVRITAERAA